VIKVKRMRWAWLVAPMGEMRKAYKILAGKPLKGADYLEDLGIDRKIISDCILGK
jgi:hypothetical protein